MRSKKTWAIVVVAAVVVAGLVYFLNAPYTVQVDGKEVSNAEEFLDDAEQEWHDGLPSYGVNVSDDASCYYEVSSGSSSATGDASGYIYCGPVRRYDAAAGRVWDTYKFGTISGESGEAVVASNLHARDTSTSATIDELANASGDSPDDDADQLALPDLPTTKDLYVAQPPDDAVDASIQMISGDQIRNPAGTVTLYDVYTTPWYDDRDSVVKPAEGYQLVLLEMGFQPDSDAATYFETLSVTARSGEKEYDVTDAVISVTTEDPRANVLVALPDSDDASLVVTHAGHEQAFMLSDGQRVSDPVTDTDYRTVETDGLSKTQPVEASLPNGQVATYDFGLQLSGIMSYAGAEYGVDLGYAGKGSMWYVVQKYDGVSVGAGDYAPVAEPDALDYSQWLVSADGASAVAPVAVSDEYVVFEVPAEAVTMSLSLTTSATFTNPAGQATVLTFGPITDSAEFPGTVMISV